MSIVERSIRQPVTVTVVVILVVIFGILGLLRVPVQLTPDVDQPVVTVTTRWFGASPEEIENEIIEEQEEVLKTVSGLREMISSCSQAEGSIRLEFYVGVDKDAALNEVRDKLRQVREYPIDVEEPVVEAVDRFNRDYIAWMLLAPVRGTTQPVLAENPAPGFTGDVTELRDFLEDEVKPILERAEGVSAVNVLGGRQRELQVRVSLQKLAARGLSIDQLVAALQRENADVSAGLLTQGKRDLSIRAVGQYKDPESIRQTVISWERSGAPIYVRDVADVVVSFKRQESFVRSLGSDVMALNAQRETGTNVMRVMDALRAAIDKVNREVIAPKGWGLELRQVYDQTVYVRRSIQQARDDLLLGAVLAAAVLFLTLRSFGATMVVAVSIPISVIGTILGMALTGRNLNVISMAGLAFAIGMGVDNTIVVLENIFRHREMGKDRIRAAIDGAQEVWGAIVAATLANIAVFLPVVFIREEAGQLFRDISIAISISLMLYLLISPTVIPMLATVFLRKMPGGFVEREDRLEEEQVHTFLGRLTRPISRLGAMASKAFYDTMIWLSHGVVRRVALVVLMVGVSCALAWMLIPPRDYLPPGNQNLVFGFVVTPPGYGLEEQRRLGQHVEAILSPWWQAPPGSPEMKRLQDQWKYARDQFMVPGMERAIEARRASMPPGAPADDAIKPMTKALAELKASPPPAGIGNFFFVAFGGAAFMGATSQDMDTVKPLTYLFEQSLQGVPGVTAFPSQMSIFRTGGIGQTVELRVSGSDINAVRTAAAATQGMLIGKFGRFVRAEPSNFELGRAETQIRVNRERAASAGIPASTVRRLARVAVDGEVVGDYRGQGRSIDLTVIADDSGRRGVEALPDLPLATGDGRVIPLSSVADFVSTTAPQEVIRTEQQPSVRLILSLNKGETISEVTNVIESQIVAPLRQSRVIAPGMTVRIAGSADKLAAFGRAFVPGFVLAAVITYLLLAALFESWLHPFVIIMSVPFALVGGFLGLAVLHRQTGQTMDVLTMLGFVILIGTIVNNPILIVHQALNYIRAGLPRQRAVALSAQTRVRPIFMSVVTSVAGMAPLVVFGGAGSELYRGLGAVVIGGLLVSTVFTLLLTPALMSLMLDAQDGMRKLLIGTEIAAPDAVAAPEPDAVLAGGRRHA